MCDFEGNLTAWLDGELASGEAAHVERHLQLCAECRQWVEAYRQVSAVFGEYCDAYCEGVLAPQHRRKLSRRKVAISGAAALAAAVAVLFLIAPRSRVRLSPVPLAAPAASEIVASKPIQAAEIPGDARPEPAPLKAASRFELTKGKPVQHAAPGPESQGSEWLEAEPAVEIAIPADAIFPPGAIPENVGFTADVTIAPDGSAQQIRLRPQFTEFERRSTRP
jgi:anti-sigma factor RsiW